MARYSTGDIGVSYKTFQALEDFIQDNNKSAALMYIADDVLAQLMAQTCLGYTKKYSAGVARTNTTQPKGFWSSGGAKGQFQKGNRGGWNYVKSKGAWSFPVPRITGDYYRGWKVKRVFHGLWMVYNESREAYYIEYGIHPSSRRVRRPVAKKATLSTLEMMWYSRRTIQRFADNIFEQIIGKSVQSPSVMPNL